MWMCPEMRVEERREITDERLDSSCNGIMERRSEIKWSFRRYQQRGTPEKAERFCSLPSARPDKMAKEKKGMNVAARKKRMRRLEDQMKRNNEELEMWFAKFDSK